MSDNHNRFDNSGDVNDDVGDGHMRSGQLDGDYDDQNREQDVCHKCKNATGHGLETAENLSWISCDKCEMWFHLSCVNMTWHENIDQEQFVCEDCIKLKQSHGGQGMKIVPNGLNDMRQM
jgi:hypothetical protein